MQEEKFNIEEAKREIAFLEKLAADPSVGEGVRMQHRNTITWIKAAIRNAEGTGAEPIQPKQAPNLSQVERSAQTAPTYQPAPERSAPPEIRANPPQPAPMPAKPQPTAQARTVEAPATTPQSSNTDALPGYLRARLAELADSLYASKSLWHKLPEYITFHRAVEYYRALCADWKREIQPADIDLVRMSQTKQRVWEEIVSFAKTNVP